MRKKHLRPGMPAQIHKIRVIPCGLNVLVDSGLFAMVVPTNAEAIPVSCFYTGPGRETLVYQRMLGVKNQVTESDRVTRISQPAAHSHSPVVDALYCNRPVLFRIDGFFVLTGFLLCN